MTVLKVETDIITSHQYHSESNNNDVLYIFSTAWIATSKCKAFYTQRVLIIIKTTSGSVLTI